MRTTLFLSALLLAVALAACGGGVDEPPCLRAGCGGAVLCEVPADPAQPGPWPVGVRTATLGELVVEVWYPARFGSERGKPQVIYDVREELPAAERAKIPDADNPWQTCRCARDLPLDERRGPYPVVIFFHGTAAFRTQSLELTTHLASRGFVVLAADHPGLKLADVLVFSEIQADLPADGAALLSALAAPEGSLAFLADRLDLARVGLAGHSAGGKAVGEATSLPGVRVAIPMAYEGAAPGPLLESVLVLGALDDQVAPYTRQQEGYAASPAPRRLVGIANAGHLAFSDLCALTNDAGQDLVEIAIEREVTNASLAELLWDGCAPGQTTPEEGWAIANYAAGAALEQALTCRPDPDPFAELTARFPLVAEYLHEP